MDPNFKMVKFCNSVGYLLASDNARTALLNRLTKYYKLDLDRAFSKYFRIAGPDDLTALQKDRHFVYFNVVAPMTLLYLTVIDGTNHCFYISRSRSKNGQIEVISVKHRFHDSLFAGDTVFEGKMVKNQHQRWSYLINDIVVHQRHTFTTDLRTKLQTINKMLEQNYIADPILDAVEISLQDFVDYQYIESFATDYLADLAYRDSVDGLIFRSVADGGASNKIVPFKSLSTITTHLPPVKTCNQEVAKIQLKGQSTISRNSICFKLKKTKVPDIYELYLTNGTTDIYVDIAGIPDLKTSQTVKRMFTNGFHYVIAVCKWDPNFKRWTPFMRSSRKVPDTPYIIGEKMGDLRSP